MHHDADHPDNTLFASNAEKMEFMQPFLGVACSSGLTLTTMVGDNAMIKDALVAKRHTGGADAHGEVALIAERAGSDSPVLGGRQGGPAASAEAAGQEGEPDAGSAASPTAAAQV